MNKLSNRPTSITSYQADITAENCSRPFWTGAIMRG